LPKCERGGRELLLVSALLAGACAGTRATGDGGTREPSGAVAAAASCPELRITTAEARRLVDEYCVSCHSAEGAAGEDYDFRSDTTISARRHNLEAKLRLHAMPPPNAPQPDDAERAALRCWASD
jgi:uncharacterized membrane protein